MNSRLLSWVLVGFMLFGPVAALQAQEAQSDEKTLSKAVQDAGTFLKEKTRHVKTVIHDVIKGSSGLAQALEELKKSPKNLKSQGAFLDKMIVRCNEVRGSVGQIHNADLKGAYDGYITGYGELISFQRRKLEEAKTRAKNEKSPSVKKRYEQIAASIERIIRGYNNDVAKLEKQKENVKLSVITSQIEYLNFFHGYLVSYKSQLPLLGGSGEVIRELEQLSKNLDELDKYLSDFSVALIKDDIFNDGNGQKDTSQNVSEKDVQKKGQDSDDKKTS